MCKYTTNSIYALILKFNIKINSNVIDIQWISNEISKIHSKNFNESSFILASVRIIIKYIKLLIFKSDYWNNKLY